MLDFDSFERFESFVYELLTHIEVDSGEYLSEVSLCLHETIEDVVADYGRDNDIYDDYEQLY